MLDILLDKERRFIEKSLLNEKNKKKIETTII